MTELNRHLKENKTVVLFTIFTFLYTACFSGCSKPKEKQQMEAVAAATSAGTEKKEDPCECPPTKRIFQGLSFRGSRLSPSAKRPEPSQLADEMERYFRALEDLLKEIPRDTFDPRAIMDKVGADQELLFKWVRDNTVFIPYEGSLRGPVGVLMDRYGNSLDRALLLHELLRLAGHDARLARGRLSDQQAEAIFKEIRGPLPQNIQPTQEFLSQDVDGFIKETANKYQIDPTKLKGAIERLNGERASFSKAIADRVGQQTSLIADAMKKFREPENGESLKVRRDALRDHWWVQIAKEERWFDLDPASAEREPGHSLTEAETTCQPDEISDEDLTRVKLTVFIEKYANGNIEEHPVLEHLIRPSEQLGKRIALSHVPMNWPRDLDLIKDKDPVQSFKACVIKETEWQPVLIEGSERIARRSFTDAGDIKESPGNKGGPGGVSQITRGLFGALGGRKETSAEAKGDSFLTAEWVEYEILSPGHPARKIRRQVFDLIGPAKRQAGRISLKDITDAQRLERGLAVLGETDILILVCGMSPYYLGYLTANNLLSNSEILVEYFRSIYSAKTDRLLSAIQEMTPLPGPEYVLASVRHNWSKMQASVYLDRPNIMNYFRSARLDPRGQILLRQGFDVVSNEVSVYPSPGTDAFQASLYQGVLDTNAEALMLEESGSQVENVAEYFAKSRAEGIEWLTVQDSRSPVLKGADIPEDVRVRVEQDLSDGYIVMVPKRQISGEGGKAFGWWRIDPSNGNVLGFGSDGSGQAIEEYALVMSHATSFIVCVLESMHDEELPAKLIRPALCGLMLISAIYCHIGWHLSEWVLFRVSAILGVLVEIATWTF